jgi:eukaryotic-like serine/threonine-protein kinase
LLTDDPARLRSGSEVGRYLVIDLVGVGGMGAVYRAYDRQLERRVALKIVRAQLARAGVDVARERARLEQEARALARLSHPNVVTCFDAGTLGDSVFVAMEYVDGKTLRHVMSDGPPERHRIVATFRQIAEGLAAVHDAGLIHGDVKPENVIIGADGRACITDFGLARPTASTIARDGDVRGTPMYMSPEQLSGRAPDARSDQYAFGVMLFEATYGARPFDGATPAALLADIRARRIAATSRRGPRRVATIADRALAFDPERRFADMHEVARALSRPSGPIVVVGLAGALIVGAALTSALFASRVTAHDVCAGPETGLAEPWASHHRVAIHRTFADRSMAREGSLIVAHLDQFSVAWRDARRTACLATHGGHRDDSGYQIALACLDHRARQVSELVKLVATSAEPAELRHALASVYGTADLSLCLDPRLAAMPSARGRSPENDDAERELAAARASIALGRYEHARGQARELSQGSSRPDQIRQRAAALALEADAEVRLGHGARAVEVYRAAAAAAAEAGDDLLLAEVWIDQVFPVAHQAGRPEDALVLAEVAENLVGRLGGSPILRGRLLRARSLASWRLGRYEPARIDLIESEKLIASVAGRVHPRVAGVLDLRAALESDMGANEAAAMHAERALSIYVSTLGEGHPTTLAALQNVGWYHLRAAKPRLALDAFERAAQRLPGLVGREHRDVATVLTNMGQAHLDLGDTAAGLAACEEALEIAERALPPDHPDKAFPLTCVGEARLAAASTATAIAALERAVDLSVAFSDPAKRAGPLLALARALWSTGRDRRRAREIFDDVRRELSTGGPRGESMLRDLDVWLVAHGGQP